MPCVTLFVAMIVLTYFSALEFLSFFVYPQTDTTKKLLLQKQLGLSFIYMYPNMSHTWLTIAQDKVDVMMSL